MTRKYKRFKKKEVKALIIWVSHFGEMNWPRFSQVALQLGIERSSASARQRYLYLKTLPAIQEIPTIGRPEHRNDQNISLTVLPNDDIMTLFPSEINKNEEEIKHWMFDSDEKRFLVEKKENKKVKTLALKLAEDSNKKGKELEEDEESKEKDKDNVEGNKAK